jgi:hypothetical protein
MILEAGTFRVADYRRAIPCVVKQQVIINQCARWALAVWRDGKIVKASELEFDHCPALCARQYDTVNQDFIPQQNDPEYIVAVLKEDHLYKTTGRKPGAEKTVTTRGSDVVEAARAKKIKAHHAEHLSKMAVKAGQKYDPERMKGNPEPWALSHAGEPKKKFKRKWPTRPFPKRSKKR